jgi:hypothetical protein
VAAALPPSPSRDTGAHGALPQAGRKLPGENLITAGFIQYFQKYSYKYNAVCWLNKTIRFDRIAGVNAGIFYHFISDYFTAFT